MPLPPGMPIPDDWNGLDWCEWSICWPDSMLWRAILAGFISSPSRGRFWDGDTGTVTDAQAIGNEIYAANLPLKESLMSCTGAESLAAAIQYLADRLADKPCCGAGAPGVISGGGSAGAGSAPADPSTGADSGEESYPDGFDSYEEYRAYKCAVSDAIVKGIQDDYSTMSTVNFVGFAAATIVGTLAPLLVTPAALPDLLVMVGVLIVIIEYSGDALDDAQTAITNAYDDLVCALFMAPNVAAAESQIELVFAQQIDVDAGDALIAWNLKNSFNALVGTDALNKLFTKDSSRTYPAADCDACVTGGYYRLAVNGESVVVAAWEDGDEIEISGTSDGSGFLFGLSAHSISNPSDNQDHVICHHQLFSELVEVRTGNQIYYDCAEAYHNEDLAVSDPTPTVHRWGVYTIGANSSGSCTVKLNIA